MDFGAQIGPGAVRRRFPKEVERAGQRRSGGLERRAKVEEANCRTKPNVWPASRLHLVGAISRRLLVAALLAGSISLGRAIGEPPEVAGTQSAQLVAASEQVAAGDNGFLPSGWPSAAPDLLQVTNLLGAAASSNDEAATHHHPPPPPPPPPVSTSASPLSNKSHLLLLFVLLVLINLIVILGNILVIVAFYATAKLRSVTNIFIVSLATADLLLGLLVLPYALMFEILDVWIFGQVWCRGWLVTDVWISTASILNLCAISIDRYVAVTRPVKYRSIMTPRRAKTIVACVWIVSFLICFPPLLPQWKPAGLEPIGEAANHLHSADLSWPPASMELNSARIRRQVDSSGRRRVEMEAEIQFASRSVSSPAKPQIGGLAQPHSPNRPHLIKAVRMDSAAAAAATTTTEAPPALIDGRKTELAAGAAVGPEARGQSGAGNGINRLKEALEPGLGGPFGVALVREPLRSRKLMMIKRPPSKVSPEIWLLAQSGTLDLPAAQSASKTGERRFAHWQPSLMALRGRRASARSPASASNQDKHWLVGVEAKRANDSSPAAEVANHHNGQTKADDIMSRREGHKQTIIIIDNNNTKTTRTAASGQEEEANEDEEGDEVETDPDWSEEEEEEGLLPVSLYSCWLPCYELANGDLEKDDYSSFSAAPKRRQDWLQLPTPTPITRNGPEEGFASKLDCSMAVVCKRFCAKRECESLKTSLASSPANIEFSLNPKLGHKSHRKPASAAASSRLQVGSVRPTNGIGRLLGELGRGAEFIVSPPRTRKHPKRKQEPLQRLFKPLRPSRGSRLAGRMLESGPIKAPRPFWFATKANGGGNGADDTQDDGAMQSVMKSSSSKIQLLAGEVRGSATSPESGSSIFSPNGALPESQAKPPASLPNPQRDAQGGRRRRREASGGRPITLPLGAKFPTYFGPSLLGAAEARVAIQCRDAASLLASRVLEKIELLTGRQWRKLMHVNNTSSAHKLANRSHQSRRASQFHQIGPRAAAQTPLPAKEAAKLPCRRRQQAPIVLLLNADCNQWEAEAETELSGPHWKPAAGVLRRRRLAGGGANRVPGSAEQAPKWSPRAAELGDTIILLGDNDIDCSSAGQFSIRMVRELKLHCRQLDPTGQRIREPLPKQLQVCACKHNEHCPDRATLAAFGLLETHKGKRSRPGSPDRPRRRENNGDKKLNKRAKRQTAAPGQVPAASSVGSASGRQSKFNANYAQESKSNKEVQRLGGPDKVSARSEVGKRPNELASGFEQVGSTMGPFAATKGAPDGEEAPSDIQTDDGGSIFGLALGQPERQTKKSGCALFDHKSYVIYSALGSFYIPMLIMLFFYSRIYLVASRAQKALERGYMTTKWPPVRTGANGRRPDDLGSGSGAAGAGQHLKVGSCGESASSERVTLRIHRREKVPALEQPSSGDLIDSASAANNQARNLFSSQMNGGGGGGSSNSRQQQPTSGAGPDFKSPKAVQSVETPSSVSNVDGQLEASNNIGPQSATATAIINELPNGLEQSRPMAAPEQLEEVQIKRASLPVKPPFPVSGADEIQGRQSAGDRSWEAGIKSSAAAANGRQEPLCRLRAGSNRHRDGQHGSGKHHHHHHGNHNHHRHQHQHQHQHRHQHRHRHRRECQHGSAQPTGGEATCSTGKPVLSCLVQKQAKHCSMRSREEQGARAGRDQLADVLERPMRDEIMVSSIAEECSLGSPLIGEPEEPAPSGGLETSADSSPRTEHSSIGSIQITVVQCDDQTNLPEGPTSGRLPDEGCSNSPFGLNKESIKIEVAKCERSLSVDVPHGGGGERNQANSDSLLDVGSQLGRVDRSHSCGPAPTIVVNWDPETCATDSRLAPDATGQPLSRPLERTAGGEQPANALNGSQGSGLSIMSSLPMAANQVRKQSMMLLSSITMHGSQTLRRLSMVATHPVDSLLNRGGRARDDTNTTTTSDGEELEASEGDEPGKTVRSGRAGGKRSKKRRRKKHPSKSRPLSSASSAPKRTFDDYLMAVTGVDRSSDEEDDYGEDEEEDEEEEEEGDTDEIGALRYSLLVRQDREGSAADPNLMLTSSSRESSALAINHGQMTNQPQAASAGTVQGPIQALTTDGQQLRVGNLTNERPEVGPVHEKVAETVKADHDSDDEADQEDLQRPPSVLYRQGALYERATSRTGKEMDKPNDLKRSIQNGSVRSNALGLFRDSQSAIGRLSSGKSKGLAVVGKVGVSRRRGAKRTSRWHAKRLHAETKAAKTVAIIIGGFIFCWLPFFTAYLSRAIICERSDCVPQSLLSVFIWLGYLNSAINPLIYGLFSKEFRHAFKNIICRCRFRNTDDTVVVSVLVDSIIKSIL